ncbi:MAG: HAMP domain-containing sensor histidine kinase [Christensenella sp.]|uniref:sensor histidine kinase n=1 Tax=Christensenella sp. TaxID=1935934 RepID=UPI002B1FCD11|nr:HAMP domain-containing sensor histidine kinase [Christensenella sp.]MEA5002089.1 HAMP domain-containing sensor histidine kinase [Christensenella sp.]
MSIKWKIFIYILVFAAIMILLLWLFQIVFLNDFYQSIKKGEIRDAAQVIEQNIDNEDIDTLIERISHQYDVCVRIADENGENVYTSDIMPDCVIHKMPAFEFSILAQDTQENGGSMLRILPQKKFSGNEYDARRFMGNVPPPDSGITESMIYTKTVTAADGQTMLLALNSVITPVNSTVETLRVQLIYITVILIVCALVIALIIAKRVSNPIIKINKAAKKLAKAQYEVKFDGHGYREIAELAATLNYAAHELSKVDNLRRELIANISHDLRTPLTMITGYAEVMRDLPGENTPENVQIVIDEAQRLTTLVNDVMDISKMQSGAQELRIAKFNLTQMIRDILTRYTKLGEQEGYHISFEQDGEVMVEADEARIGQVVYNLINNAITYAGEGKNVVVRQSVEGDTVRIEVCDDGEGIAEEQLPYIWERYYKASKTHKRAAVGTGLGLSIVKGILDMHGAEYGVSSAQGSGSTFWFILKIK